jgi:endonuclease/exonuclease/phosphatase family metal-dependent hydrolase
VREVFDGHETSFGLTALLRKWGVHSSKVKPARTFPAAMPWLRLDRVYVRGFDIESAEVLRGQTWSRLSDHAPIVTTLHI